MGSVISSIFGGGGYEAPDPIEYDPMPTRDEAAEPEAESVRESERRKIRARRSMSGTLLTSPLGVNGGSGASGASTGSGPGVLGRL